MLILQIQRYITTHNLFAKGECLLVAVSGGADSVVLAHLLHTLGYNIALAHCNFRLRGADSDADEAFVKVLATKLNVPVYTTTFDTKTYKKTNQVNTQVAARELRYAWFASIINPNTTTPYKAVVTAHHATDNAETIVMNLCKGTGIRGLQGMQPKANKVIRPLLFATRDAIETFAQQNTIPYRTDESNASNDYTRNYIRNKVLPLLLVKYPTLILNINNTAQHITEANQLYSEAITQKIKKIVEIKQHEVHIPILKLQAQTAYSTLLHHIIQPYNFAPAQVPDALQLLTADNSKYIQSSTHQLVKNRNWLIITPLYTQQAEHIVIDKLEVTIKYATSLLSLHTATNHNLPQVPTTALLQANTVVLPLVLRPWKMGDYFYPLGMPKKKKVARYLIDAKLSKPEKDAVWVLQDATQKIIWVIGQRISDKCKVTDTTKPCLLLTTKSA